MVTMQVAKIKTLAGSERGFLVFEGETLVAVLAQLDGMFYGPDHGRWFIEATFGLGYITHDNTFETERDARAWLEEAVARALG